MTSTGPVVWIVNHYTTIPLRDGAGQRHFRLAQELSNHGWRPVLLLASTTHPGGDQFLEPGERQRVGHDGGVLFAMLRAPAYRGGVQRLWNMVGFARSLVSRRASRDLPAPDLVVGSTVHLLAAWGALRLARRHGVPFVYEIRDIWPETLIDLGRLKSGSVIARLTAALSRHLSAHATLVLSPLPGVRDHLDTLGLSHVPFEWVSNGVDLADDAPSSSPRDDEDFVFMYLGSLGNANGVQGMLEAFDRACATRGARDLRLRVVGDGSRRESLRHYASSLDSADRISFEERIPRGDVAARAREADALVVNIEDLAVYRFGISLNKLFDYLAAERPVVIATSASNNPVAEADAGITVPAGDMSRFAEAMLEISELSPEQRAAMGARGRSHVEKTYTFPVLGERLAAALTSAMDRARESGARRT